MICLVTALNILFPDVTIYVYNSDMSSLFRYQVKKTEGKQIIFFLELLNVRFVYDMMVIWQLKIVTCCDLYFDSCMMCSLIFNS